MMVLVTYDVNTETPQGQQRLRKIAKHCQDYGQRVQNSVFECLVDPAQFTALKGKLESTMDKQKDSIRYYQLGSNWNRRVDHVGTKGSYNPEGVIIL